MFSDDIQNLQLIYESILTEALLGKSATDLPMDKPYGFWLAPDGMTFAVVPVYGHARIAMDIIKKYPKKFKYSSLVDRCDAYLLMFYEKWIRIHTGDTKLEFESYEMDEKNNQPIYKKVKDDVFSHYTRRVSRNLKDSPEGMRQLNWMKYICGLYDLEAIEDGEGNQLWRNRN